MREVRDNAQAVICACRLKMLDAFSRGICVYKRIDAFPVDFFP